MRCNKLEPVTVAAINVPELSVGAFSSNPTYLALRERVYEGMRKAGVPEG
jgi:hypothetical protein